MNERSDISPAPVSPAQAGVPLLVIQKTWQSRMPAFADITTVSHIVYGILRRCFSSLRLICPRGGRDKVEQCEVFPLVVQKKSRRKQTSENQSPVSTASHLERGKNNSAPSGEGRQNNQSKSDSDVSEEAIVSLTRALVRWTAVLAFATILLGIAAFCRWLELRKTDRHVADQLDELKAEQRPWVAINLSLTTPNKADDPFRIESTYLNIGHKPAYKMLHYCKTGLGTSDKGLEPMLQFDPANIKPQGDGVVMLPNSQTNDVPSVLNIPSQDEGVVNLIVTSAATLWVTCRAEYLDGEKQLHSTTVRGKYDPTNKVLISVNPGNDAD